MNQAELFTLIQKVNRESYSTIPGLVVLCFFFFKHKFEGKIFETSIG